MSDDRRFYRHRLWVRVTHWINVVCLTRPADERAADLQRPSGALLGRALRLSTVRSSRSARARTATAARAASPRSLGHSFDTTGVLGLSSEDGADRSRAAFPPGSTMPSYQDLATGRRWHFFFAWLLRASTASSTSPAAASSRHLRRDLVPTRARARPYRPQSIGDHLRLRFPKGEEAKRYNVLQKLAYLVVVFVLVPADDPRRASPCRRGSTRSFPQPARPLRRPADRRARSISSAPSRFVALRRRPPRHGAGLGRLEQSALDDHRPVRSSERSDERADGR